MFPHDTWKDETKVQEHKDYVRKICTVVSRRNNNKLVRYTTNAGGCYHLLPEQYTELTHQLKINLLYTYLSYMERVGFPV